MPPPQLQEVFKISGVPTYTFVEPKEWQRLKVALRTPGRGIVIEGPSGIGKTTAIETALSKEGLGKVTKLSARRVDDVELIKALPSIENIGTVIVDDFQKLPDDAKQQLADYMKTLADKEDATSKLIIVGINLAGENLIHFAADLVNRLDIIPFESNSAEKVEELVTQGERALNIHINVKREVVEASQGSFYIAQMLCHEICLGASVLQAESSEKRLEESFEAVRAQVFDRLAQRFKEPCKHFCRGTKMRPEGRAPYLHILHWLAESKEWTISLPEQYRRHHELKGSVGQVVDKGYLKHHIESHAELTNLLHYDGASKQLTVEDPQFVFYIRNMPWLHFARELGFHGVEFTNRYDFALSFAGPDRDIAEALFNALQDEEVEVFYDRHERHRMLAQDIEEYLRPIYQTEARFVICLLGREYPKRIWTRFESQQFRDRFKDGNVIPIWFSDVEPSAFDEARKVGGLEFDRSKPTETQITEIKNILLKKLSEARVADARE